MNIHPDDWAIILRAPRWSTVQGWLIWFVLSGPIIYTALISVVRWRRDRRLRPFLWCGAALLALITAYFLYAGLELRSVQARCWRAGSSAVPEVWRSYCEHIPPQHGMEGYY